MTTPDKTKVIEALVATHGLITAELGETVYDDNAASATYLEKIRRPELTLLDEAFMCLTGVNIADAADRLTAAMQRSERADPATTHGFPNS